MVFHHFRKEFRWLRLRWFVYLALLAFDLAVSLEWLFPLQAGRFAPGWLAFLPWVLVLSGASLFASCPEDQPGSDRSFISTRPLPLHAYWLARVAVWLLLIVTPAVLQTLLYLVLSGRPAAEVLASTGERAATLLAHSAWLLPLTALWRRGEFWLVLAFLAAGWLLADRAVDFLALTIGQNSFALLPTATGKQVADALFALGLCGLAWWHQTRRSAGFRTRLAAMLAVALASMVAGRLWPWPEDERGPGDPALVQQLAPTLQVQADLPLFSFAGFEDPMQRNIMMPLRSTTGHATVSVVPRAQHTTLTQRGHSQSVTVSPFWRSRRFLAAFNNPVWKADRVLRDLFPPGTLFTTQQANSRWSDPFPDNTLHIGEFAAPFPDPHQPLNFTTEFEVDWHQRELEMNLPLIPGSSAESDAHVWRILSVEEHRGANGQQALGNLSVELHVQSRNPVGLTPEDGVLMLHSPQRRLVWAQPLFETPGPTRGGSSHWARQTVRLGWSGVLNHADGEATGADVTQLRLVYLRSHFLGTTPLTWKSPDIRLSDHPPADDSIELREQFFYRGLEIKAFQERVATLPRPSASTPEKEARRYLYDLLATTCYTGVARKKAADAEVAAAFRPLMDHHMPLLLEVPGTLWPGRWNGPPLKLLADSLTEDWRETVIDHALDNRALVRTVIDKGWAEQARRLQPRLLANHRLPLSTGALLLAWGDAASHERLIQELRHLTNEEYLEELDKVPALRPRLEQLTRDNVATALPMMSQSCYKQTLDLACAANFGDAAALDLCLRWLAMGCDRPAPSCSVPYPKLLGPDGTPLWQPMVDGAQQWPRYRHLKASDFDYLPAYRAWKLRQP